jgi:hypothetical protein
MVNSKQQTIDIKGKKKADSRQHKFVTSWGAIAALIAPIAATTSPTCNSSASVAHSEAGFLPSAFRTLKKSLVGL